MTEILPVKILSDSPINKQVSWRVSGMTEGDFAEFETRSYRAMHFGADKQLSGFFKAGDLVLQDVTNPARPATWISDAAGLYFEPTKATERGFHLSPVRAMRLVYKGTGSIDALVTLLR
jgi:hypothetical protein